VAAPIEHTTASARRDLVQPVRRFFVCVFAVTWGMGLVGLLVPRLFPGGPAFSHTSPFYWLAAYAVSLIGIGMTASHDGRPGLGRLFNRLRPWRARPHWYLIVLGGYTLITAAAWQLGHLFGAAPAVMPGPGALLGGVVLSVTTDPGPIGEEFGWRGFVLPRLLVWRSPLGASLILGAVHAAWHIPLFFIPGLAQAQVSFPFFVAGVLSIAVIDTWLYLRSDANLLLAILVHLMTNYCGGLLGPPGFPYFVAAQAAAAIAVVGCGGLRARVRGAASPIDIR
jgi:hypothetical protein